MSNPHQIQQEIVFDVAPAKVYATLMKSDQHAAFTGAEATISEDDGGTFSCHGGVISGRNIELVKDERIVQAWRVGNWAPGVYSMTRYELAPAGSGKTRLTFTHEAFPEGQGEHLAQGWHDRYWTPMKKFFAG